MARWRGTMPGAMPEHQLMSFRLTGQNSHHRTGANYRQRHAEPEAVARAQQRIAEQHERECNAENCAKHAGPLHLPTHKELHAEAHQRHAEEVLNETIGAYNAFMVSGQ